VAARAGAAAAGGRAETSRVRVLTRLPGLHAGRTTGRVPLGLAVAVCALFPCAARAQPAREVNEQYQFWGSLNSTTRLADRWGAIADVHVRRNDFMAEPSFDFLRFGAHYWVSENLTLSLGYAHLWQAPTCDGCETWTNENRVYQQLQYVTRLGRATLLHRVRNEQRWKETVEDDVLTGGTSFTDRVRYLASFTVPVSGNPGVPALVVADEVAVQFGPGVVYNTFDQNRLFLGMKQALSRSWSFDLGYMLVYQQKASGYQYDLDHTLRWFFYFTPDLRKQKGTHHPASGEE
jgi:hypothetical protein